VKEKRFSFSFEGKVKRAIVTPSLVRPDYYQEVGVVPFTTHRLKSYSAKKSKSLGIEERLLLVTFEDDGNTHLGRSYFERPSNF
jgi:hypothetical protein